MSTKTFCDFCSQEIPDEQTITGHGELTGITNWSINDLCNLCATELSNRITDAINLAKQNRQAAINSQV